MTGGRTLLRTTAGGRLEDFPQDDGLEDSPQDDGWRTLRRMTAGGVSSVTGLEGSHHDDGALEDSPEDDRAGGPS
jgi:hypothetical protein